MTNTNQEILFSCTISDELLLIKNRFSNTRLKFVAVFYIFVFIIIFSLQWFFSFSPYPYLFAIGIGLVILLIILSISTNKIILTKDQLIIKKHTFIQRKFPLRIIKEFKFVKKNIGSEFNIEEERLVVRLKDGKEVILLGYTEQLGIAVSSNFLLKSSNGSKTQISGKGLANRMNTFFGAGEYR